MKRFLYILSFVLIYSSCVKEHDIFYPYKKDSISYLELLQGEKNYIVFENSDGLNYQEKNGLIISIDKNSFETSVDSIILQWQIIDSVRKVLAHRYSMVEKLNYLISPIAIVDYKIKDKKGNDISIKSNNYINFNIPDSSGVNAGIHRYELNKWILSKSGEEVLSHHNWTININNEPESVSGYLLKTKKSGVICISKYLERNWQSGDVFINLKKGFDVGNSIVQVMIPGTKFNMELSWDNDNKAFKIPSNFLFPHNKLNIIVLSEDENKNPYFGMKYAEISDENNIYIDVFKSKTEEIRNLLDKI